jgi:hypothetical protein
MVTMNCDCGESFSGSIREVLSRLMGHNMVHKLERTEADDFNLVLAGRKIA